MATQVFRRMFRAALTDPLQNSRTRKGNTYNRITPHSTNLHYNVKHLYVPHVRHARDFRRHLPVKLLIRGPLRNLALTLRHQTLAPLDTRLQVILRAFRTYDTRLSFTRARLRNFNKLVIPNHKRPSITRVSTTNLSMITTRLLVLSVNLRVSVTVNHRFIILPRLRLAPRTVAMGRVSVATTTRRQHTRIMLTTDPKRHNRKRSQRSLVPLHFRLTQNSARVFRRQRTGKQTINNNGFRPRLILRLYQPVPRGRLTIRTNRALNFTHNLLNRNRRQFSTQLVSRRRSLIFQILNTSSLSGRLITFTTKTYNRLTRTHRS